MSVVELLDTVQKHLNSNNMKTQFINNRPGKGFMHFYAVMNSYLKNAVNI